MKAWLMDAKACVLALCLVVGFCLEMVFGSDDDEGPPAYP